MANNIIIALDCGKANTKVAISNKDNSEVILKSYETKVKEVNLDKETDRKRTEQSFFVDVEEIRENGYDLSINKYKEIEYEEVVYDEPKVILERVRKLEEEIKVGIDELERMIEE